MGGRRPKIVSSLVAGWALVALSLPHPAAADGLSASLGEVVVENLGVGRSCSLKALANLGLSLANSADRPVRVCIEALVPDSSELRRGAEPIPDARWAVAVPETLDLAAGGAAAADLVLSIPDDEALVGRKFQVTFWSRTLPRPGEILALGLKSRVIFTVVRRDGPDPTPSGDCSIALGPEEIRLGSLVPGRRYRLERAAPAPLTVRNTSKRRLAVKLSALAPRAAGLDPEGRYADLAGAAGVVLTPAAFSLEPGEERTIRGTLALGPEAGLAGRDLMCVIAASATDQSVSTRIFARVSARGGE